MYLIFYTNGESANDTFKYVHTVWMCLMALLAVSGGNSGFKIAYVKLDWTKLTYIERDKMRNGL